MDQEMKNLLRRIDRTTAANLNQSIANNATTVNEGAATRQRVDVQSDVCEKPCIKDIQQRLAPLDLIDDIMNRLNQLGNGSGNWIDLEVPIVICPDDGPIEVTTVTVGAMAEAADLYLSLFTQLADVKREQCENLGTGIEVKFPILEAKDEGKSERKEETIRVPAAHAPIMQALFQEVSVLKEYLVLMEFDLDRTHSLVGGKSVMFSVSEMKRLKENPRKPVYRIKQQEFLNQMRINGVATKFGESGHDGNFEFFSLADYNYVALSMIGTRLGVQQFPAELPESLLAYSDGKEPADIRSIAGYMTWIVQQVDTLVGQFPIEIEIEDSDPTKPGNQTKKIELPNIAEALAELFGLSISSSTNSDLGINFMMRLAAEVIATKNAALITQDYAKANAAFLGYRGNTKKRKIPYAFDPTALDRIDTILKNSEAEIEGWEEDDKNSVLSYLQKLMFSAGIIKTVFFRSNSRVEQFQKELESLSKEGKANDDEVWQKFLALMNNPLARFNTEGDNPTPKVNNEPNP